MTMIPAATSTLPAIQVLRVTTELQAQEFCALSPALSPQHYRQGQVDQHLLAYVDGQAVARCSLWWRAVPYLPGERIGCIGHYATLARTVGDHAFSDRAAAAELLATACAELQQANCTIAVGPLDGSTFRAYRFVTERALQGGDPLPPFLFEPNNADAWPADFVAAGFRPWSEYVSDLAPLTGPDPKLASRTEMLAAQGVHLRGLDPAIFATGSHSAASVAAFERELARFYPLVMTAFAKSPLFTPLSYDEFAAQYAPVRALLAPELVALAEREGELVGFLFALPNFAQAQRGETINTVILKTIAVLPSLAGIGLGSLLTAQVHTQAYHLGYRWAIHALMHVQNRSRRISAHTAQPFRRYTLFARPL